MPPRYAYWTIIVEGKPTAFRAQHRDDLLPTLRQLQARHPDTVMMWFARGRLWGSPEEAQAASRGGTERRPGDWRPGGEHRDPRARFALSRDEKRRRFAARQRRDHRDARPAGGDRPDRREPPSGPDPRRSGGRFTPRPPTPRAGESSPKHPPRPGSDRRTDTGKPAWGGRGDAGDRRDSRAGGSGPHKSDRTSRGPQGTRERRGGWREGGGPREGTSGRTRPPGEHRDRPPHGGGDRSKPGGRQRGGPVGRKPGGGRGGRGGGGTGR
jgi:hypothetical protein